MHAKMTPTHPLTESPAAAAPPSASPQEAAPPSEADRRKGKCSLPPAPPAERKRKYPLSPKTEGRFIAAIVSQIRDSCEITIMPV